MDTVHYRSVLPYGKEMFWFWRELLRGVCWSKHFLFFESYKHNSSNQLKCVLILCISCKTVFKWLNQVICCIAAVWLCLTVVFWFLFCIRLLVGVEANIIPLISVSSGSSRLESEISLFLPSVCFLFTLTGTRVLVFEGVWGKSPAGGCCSREPNVWQRKTDGDSSFCTAVTLEKIATVIKYLLQIPFGHY